MELNLIDGRFAVCRLEFAQVIPPWVKGQFVSITRTNEELSIVCAEENVPLNVTCEKGWRGFRVAGKIPFATVGVLSSLTEPIASAGISLFAISTFDTDYVLVKENDLQRTLKVLKAAGHSIATEIPSSAD